MNSDPGVSADSGRGSVGGYQVVARRYRPQTFEDLVGQSQVAVALSNAIRTDRVGHAYLFTGARGVGKTSSARIFAKCLNCEQGPTDSPCGQCDVCEAVNEGQDVDVIEIDGASNRGINEIRELRTHINVRPTRCRYKIYIIDEVHMLTREAFNALLKTLEEPPSHAKFIFCTTDPNKLPITVLSRCQRFDFAPVEMNAISQRLAEICQQEGYEYEEEALRLLARKADGSMRDSQSLLEQLFSFCEAKVTVDEVNQMLGTADLSVVHEIVVSIIERNPRQALESMRKALSGGVDILRLGGQLVGYFRDMLVTLNGCGPELLLTAAPGDFDEVTALGQKYGQESTFACLQILDQSLVRIRHSFHARTLLEMALIRVCHLQNLDAISRVIEKARSGLEIVVQHAPAVNGPAAGNRSTADDSSTMQTDSDPRRSPNSGTGGTSPSIAPSGKSENREAQAKKKETVETVATVRPTETINLNSANVEEYWRKTLGKLDDILADYASNYESVAISAPNCLAVTLDSFYKEKCDAPAVKAQFENAFAEVTRHKYRIDFVARRDQPAVDKKPAISRRQRIKELEQHPLIRTAIETFDGEIIDIQKRG